MANKKVDEIPIWEKMNLTIPEAAAYSHIGINQLYNLINEGTLSHVTLKVNTKTLIKRKEFEEWNKKTICI